MKRLFGAIVLCLMLSAVPALASPPSIDGTWSVKEAVSVDGAVHGLLTLKVNYLKNQDFLDTFVFESGTLTTQTIGPVGTYPTDKRGKITVDADALQTELQNEINTDLAPDSSVTLSIDKFSITPIGANKFVGTLIITMNVTADLKGMPIAPVININCSLSGTRVLVSPPAPQGKDAAKTLKNFILKKAVKPLLSLGVIKHLP